MSSTTTFNHRGYTIYKQPQGGFYICGIKVVVASEKAAITYINDYLNKNDKARQASALKEAQAKVD